MNWATRTLVPIIVGTIIAFLAKYGINVDSAQLSGVVTGVVIGLYVILARVVEKRWPDSVVAKMLMSFGLASKQPEYKPPAAINPNRAG